MLELPTGGTWVPHALQTDGFADVRRKELHNWLVALVALASRRDALRERAYVLSMLHKVAADTSCPSDLHWR